MNQDDYASFQAQLRATEKARDMHAAQAGATLVRLHAVQQRLAAAESEIAELRAARDRLRALLTDAARVLEWGEPEPKPVLDRIRAALEGRDDE